VEVTRGVLARYHRGRNEIESAFGLQTVSAMSVLVSSCLSQSFLLGFRLTGGRIHTLPQIPHHAGLILICPLPHSGSGTCSYRRSSLPWNRTAFIILPAEEAMM
jgi:hypothetical protein